LRTHLKKGVGALVPHLIENVTQNSGRNIRGFRSDHIATRSRTFFLRAANINLLPPPRTLAGSRGSTIALSKFLHQLMQTFFKRSVVPEYGDDVERVSATRSARPQCVSIRILGTGVTQSNDIVFITNVPFY
jgi:hypothetical protein